mgnify:CR=1 FL=1
MKRIPIVSLPIRSQELSQIFRGLISPGSVCIEDFEKTFANVLGSTFCMTVNSAKTAAYLVLKHLATLSEKKEVLLPAYTADSLILVIKKAGLVPVLCDISQETFDLDNQLLRQLISKNTLAVLAVHMFGLACDLPELLEIAKKEKIFLIEDCAQAQGTKINSRMAGTLGDCGFFSFNRGKNIPTYSGGCFVTNSIELRDGVVREISQLKEPNFFAKATLISELFGLSLVMRPGVYGLAYPFLAPFKSNTPSRDFTSLKYTNIQAALGSALLEKISYFSKKRYDNGIYLMNGLKNSAGIILPKIIPDTVPAFNRFPLVFADLKRREKAINSLSKIGIESSLMYQKPLHKLFDLGYKEDAFPNATYLAEHLLTLPVHPFVKNNDLDKIIEVIKCL